jgi:flagellar hook protein FlgE
MPSFSIPLSGLDASSTALTVIADNLANENTVGFKSQEAQFQDLFYQQFGTSGSGNPIQQGIGVSVAATTSDLTQGSIQATGVPTDAAIQGSGYFVVNKGGALEYTRAGNFTLSDTGALLTQDGAAVMGYPAVNGVVTPGGALSPLQITSGTINPPKATANVQTDLNLDADAAVNGTFSTPVTVYDSLGATHVLTLDFTKTASNTWNYNLTIPAADVGGTGAPVSLKTGTLTFNGSGQLTGPATDVTGITVPGLANGAAALTFNWNLYDGSGNGLLTQVSGASSTTSTHQDGFATGGLQSFTISADGTISGTFSNGETGELGQIAVASFTNEQGLVRDGSNLYTTSPSSGEAAVGVAGTNGRGTIAGGSLESSNVDIATQFAALIVAERGYQANAKAVTTFDEVSQTAIGLIT